VFNIYKGKGHEVNNVEFFDTEDTPIHTLLADNEFQSLKGEIENDGVQVHVVTKNEHVPEVECQNRVIKERAVFDTKRNDLGRTNFRLQEYLQDTFWFICSSS